MTTDVSEIIEVSLKIPNYSSHIILCDHLRESSNKAEELNVDGLPAPG